jgi:CRP/FNR family cyclic AMP-dependent transcriptional regulator
MATESKVSLLEVDPDFGRFLSEEDRLQAARVSLPALDVRGEFDLMNLLERAHAFGIVVSEGMLLHRIRIGEQATLRLLGPGEMLSVSPGPQSRLLVAESDCSAMADTRLVLLDDRMLVAAQRWPRLFAGLQQKSAEQAERISVQLAICQLPRVSDRLLALLWLLAESWGRVTPSGVSLPLALTHDALGGMIGARRPTVTLALGELADRGAVVRQDVGWLLLEQFTEPAAAKSRVEAPQLLVPPATSWRDPSATAPAAVQTHAELMASVARLRDEHLEARERIRERVAQLQRSRERVQKRRERIAEETVKPRPAPSS